MRGALDPIIRHALALLLGSGASACAASGPAADRSAPTGEAATSSTRAPALPAATVGPTSDVALSTDVVARANAARRAAGVRALATDARLSDAARLHAQQMARAGRLAHVLPGTALPTPRDRLAAVAYAWTTYAENVAWNHPDARRAMDGWLASAGHRANLLSREFTHSGAAVARAANGEPYWVQLFARPR